MSAQSSDTRSSTWRDWSCSVHVCVQTEDPDALAQAVDVVRRLMRDVGDAVDRFRPDSDLSRINATPGTPVEVSPLTTKLVSVALRAASRTDGLCDPTVGTGLLAAGYTADIATIRREGAPTAAARPAAGWRSVALDENRRLVTVATEGLLDLGATAKAWTADQATASVVSTVGAPALVSIGGDLAVCGAGRPWRVDVGEQEGGPTQQVEISRGAVTTSSTASRRWDGPDGPRHHLIDPRSGRPASGPWRTCSVYAPTACAANEASTTALVLGEGARDWLEAHDRAARLVDHAGAITFVGAWPRPEERAA